MAPQHTLAEIVRGSDLVVQGVPVELIRRTKPPYGRPIDTVQFQVDEYLKGKRAEILTIHASRSGGARRGSGDDLLEAMAFEIGVEYVVFLVDKVSSSHWDDWDDGYIIQGFNQGMWAVDGSTAAQTASEIRMPLRDLRREIMVPLRPAP